MKRLIFCNLLQTTYRGVKNPEAVERKRKKQEEIEKQAMTTSTSGGGGLRVSRLLVLGATGATFSDSDLICCFSVAGWLNVKSISDYWAQKLKIPLKNCCCDDATKSLNRRPIVSNQISNVLTSPACSCRSSGCTT